MNLIEHALRLLDTQQALWGALLAVAAVAAAFMVAFIRVLDERIRWTGALVIISAGLMVGAGTVHVTYDAWYRHRCVHHHSDIDECYAKG